MPMHNPPHPGFTVRHDCLEPLGLTVTEGAKVLGVTRQALNNSLCMWATRTHVQRKPMPIPHSTGFSGGQLSSYVEGSSAPDFPWIHDARSQDQS
jgi:hypothetical protein